MIYLSDYQLITIIIAICSILFTAYKYIKKNEPKILDIENGETKIDYERNITILENTYKIDWGGHWFPVPLCRIDIF